MMRLALATAVLFLAYLTLLPLGDTARPPVLVGEYTIGETERGRQRRSPPHDQDPYRQRAPPPLDTPIGIF